MKKKVILFHTIAWLAFIGYEVSTIYIVAGKLGAVSDYVTHYLLNIALFYFNALVVMKNLGGEKKAYGKFIYQLIGEMTVYVFINYLLNNSLVYFKDHITRPTSPLETFAIASCWRCIYFLGLSALYGLYRNMLSDTEKINYLKNAELLKEKNQALLEKKLLYSENAILQAQINPHLFFNTLSFIYNAVYKLSGSAGEAVILLSDIMRYSIARTDEDGKAFLKDELTNVHKLVKLNQIRFNSCLKLMCNIGGDFNDYKIIPLVLLTFAENVFKYGDLQDPDDYAIIEAVETDETFYFITKNKKRANLNDFKGTGTGIANARGRLESSYPNQFHLHIEDTETHFVVNLAINLDCLCLAVIS